MQVQGNHTRGRFFKISRKSLKRREWNRNIMSNICELSQNSKETLFANLPPYHVSLKASLFHWFWYSVSDRKMFSITSAVSNTSSQINGNFERSCAYDFRYSRKKKKNEHVLGIQLHEWPRPFRLVGCGSRRGRVSVINLIQYIWAGCGRDLQMGGIGF